MIDDRLNRTKVKRGAALPQSILSEQDVRDIRSVVVKRNKLLAAASKLTNQCMADALGVHRRTVDRVTAETSWLHVD